MARKKKGLPFVVQPRLKPIVELVGSEESGQIEIERRGYLTVAEKSMVDAATADISDQGDLLAAVKQIAEAEKKSISAVFELLQSDEGSSLLEKYTMEIAAASGAAKNQEYKIKIIASTALLMSRIDNSWTVEDSMGLHPDLLDDLYALYVDEDLRSMEAFESEQSSGSNAKK